MKTATLWKQPGTALYAEERSYRREHPEFRPEPLAEVRNDYGGDLLPRRKLNRQNHKVRKPKLRLMPDPLPARAGESDGEAAIRLYLREVGQVKLLLPQEEADLIARVKKGDQKAREKLIKGNLQRVAEISSGYENIGLSRLDLISEGNLGLLKAVEWFDPADGTTFSNFSAWWIKQSIKRALSHSSLNSHRTRRRYQPKSPF